jgi:hypothetical protein
VTNSCKEAATRVDNQTLALAEPEAAGPQLASPKFSRLFWLQMSFALVALLMVMRGRGHHSTWLLLAFIVPAVRFTFQSRFRLELLDWLYRQWSALVDYPSVYAKTPWLAALAFVALPAFALFLSNDRCMGTGDTWPVIPTAWSLVMRGSLDIGDLATSAPASYFMGETLPYCTQRRGSGVYSNYPAGMVVFAVPVVAASQLVGADFSQQPQRNRLEKLTAALVSALGLSLFFLLALHLAAPMPAWLTTMLLAVGSAIFSTCGQALWQHGGLVIWSLLIIWLEFRCQTVPLPGSSLLQGLAGGMMLACRLSSVLFLAPFVIWICWGSPRRALLVGLLMVLAYAPWAWVYGATYGNVFGPSTVQLAAFDWSTSFAGSLAGVLFSPGRGLFVYQPWLLLLLLCCVPIFPRLPGQSPRSTLPKGWQGLCLVVAVSQVALVACWPCWWGGHCWGSRLLAEIIPLLALLCVRPLAVVCQARWGIHALLCLAVVSFLVHAPAVFEEADFWNNATQINDHPEQLWNWSRPPFFRPFQQ